MLGNHGVIVSGTTVEEVDERVHFLTASIRAAIERAATNMEERCRRIASHFKGATGAAAVAIAADEAGKSAAGSDAEAAGNPEGPDGPADAETDGTA